jgi:hypothetical protein
MLTRLLHHIRQNLIAYVALFIALGGTSYAAFSLPAGSVGARQLKNHSITAVKFDPRYIAGSVRVWAEVAANGHLIAGRGKPTVIAGHGSITGRYLVRWKVSSLARCLAIGGIDGSSVQNGFVQPVLEASLKRVLVVVHNAVAQDTALPFYVAVLC